MILAAAALGSALLFLGYRFVHRSHGAPPAPSISAAAPVRATAPPPIAPLPTGSTRHGPQHKRGFQARLDNYLEATRYPPSSRPLADVGTLRLPDAPPQAVRSDEAKDVKIEQRERQNMYYAAEGETATAVIEITINGKPGSKVEFSNASLAKVEGNPPVAGGGVANVEFRDDGKEPDEHAHDGAFAAFVPFRKDAIGSFVGNLTLNANLHDGETALAATFGFLYTGAPPARFTGQVREALEDGSLVLYMGFDVEKGAAYVVRSRLYDSDDKPVAFMTADDGIDVGHHELKFVAFGRLLRDLGAKSPFKARDFEAYVQLPDKYPDRLKVPIWTGPYVTRAYRAEDFSDREWTDPEKEKRVEEMRRAIDMAPE